MTWERLPEVEVLFKPGDRFWGAIGHNFSYTIAKVVGDRRFSARKKEKGKTYIRKVIEFNGQPLPITTVPLGFFATFEAAKQACEMDNDRSAH